MPQRGNMEPENQPLGNRRFLLVVHFFRLTTKNFDVANSQDASDHQKNSMFSKGAPNLNLHLPLESWEGATPNIYIFELKLVYLTSLEMGNDRYSISNGKF